MRHSPYRELTIRRPPCRKTSMHSQDLLSNETAFESDFPARRPFYSLQKLPTYINVTATRNISFPKSGVRARPVLLSFNAEGCKRKLVPLPVRASESVPTWKYLFREPQEKRMWEVFVTNLISVLRVCTNLKQSQTTAFLVFAYPCRSEISDHASVPIGSHGIKCMGSVWSASSCFSSK